MIPYIALFGHKTSLANVLGWAGLFFTVFGVVISIYTLTRVQKVRRAQTEATAVTQELLNVDQLEVDLVRVIARLRASGDADSVTLAGEIGVTLGGIQGVRKALASGPTGRGRTETSHVALGGNFFGEEFVAGGIHAATTRIDIITGRTKIVAGFYVMDALRQACERGVSVRLVGLSDEAPNEVLDDALKTVANPAPRNREDYRRQIRENRTEIVDVLLCWREAAQHNFEYRLCRGVPRVSMVRFDNDVSFGFLQLYRDAQPLELKDRQYLKVPISMALGRVMLKHFDLVWEESKQVFPAPAQALEDTVPPIQTETGEGRTP